MEDKDKDYLAVTHVGTWLWPTFAVLSVGVSATLFAWRDAHVWCDAASFATAVFTAVMMALNVGDERRVVRSQLYLRRGCVMYVVLWNAWVFMGSTWQVCRSFARASLTHSHLTLASLARGTPFSPESPRSS